MPSQIVILPDHLLRWIIQQHDLDRNLGLQHMGQVTEKDPALPPTVRIIADPQIHCPEAWSPLLGDAFVLLLRTEQAATRGFRPLPLEEATVIGILQTVREALVGLNGLSAHDRMAVARAFRAAELASMTGSSIAGRNTLNRPQETVVALALCIQTKMESQIRSLDRKLASYRAIVGRRGLDYLVARLACHVELGELLHLRPHPVYPGQTQPYLLGTARRGRLVVQRMACENLASTFDDVVFRVGPHIAVDQAAIDLTFVRTLHKNIMRGLPGKDRGGLWRSRPVLIHSPLSGRVAEPPVSPDQISAEMARFESEYLLADWAAVHPIVWAAAVHLEMVRIHPFMDGNGRTARMLLQSILLAAGLPMLPWEAVVAQRRPTYLATIDEAVNSGDPRAFVEFLMGACEQAIKLGFQMACGIRRERRALVEALVQEGVNARSAQVLADWLLVHVLTPEVSSSPHHALASLKHDQLGWTGFVDEVWYQGGQCWSLPAARKLLLAGKWDARFAPNAEAAIAGAC